MVGGGCGQEAGFCHATSRRQPPDSLMLCNNQSAAWRPQHTKVDENEAAACTRRMIAHDVGRAEEYRCPEGVMAVTAYEVLRRDCDFAVGLFWGEVYAVLQSRFVSAKAGWGYDFVYKAWTSLHGIIVDYIAPSHRSCLRDRRHLGTKYEYSTFTSTLYH